MSEDYKVADINLAEFGRREISLAENEMPALMALRDKYKERKVLPVPGGPYIRTPLGGLIPRFMNLSL